MRISQVISSFLLIFLRTSLSRNIEIIRGGSTPTIMAEKSVKVSESSGNGRIAIVIGAGPAGLATSLGLSNVCKKVFLVEKHPTFEKRGATFGMAANGQKTLDELRPGLRKYMEDIGLIGGPGGALVMVWWEMRDAFLHHARKTKNIEVLCGEEFTDIVQSDDADEVTVTFKSGLELKGHLLVGCDGVNSKVREVLNLPPQLVSDTTNFRGSLQVPETASPELRGLLEKGMVPFFAGEGREMYFVLFNFHKRHPGRLAWILATKQDIPSDGSVTPFTIIRDNVQNEGELKLLQEIFSLSEEDHLNPYPKSSIVDLSEDALSTLDGGWGGKGRITLVGDAAHGMRPTDGYGGSMALEDAVVLMRMLRDGKDDSVPALLRRFESERLPRVKRVYDNQYERYDIRMREGRSPGPQPQEFMDWLLAGV
jgi:2-polyprenyl-6-methoxyphenol hydroxylase-like FAD-dependent oxidoreductase